MDLSYLLYVYDDHKNVSNCFLFNIEEKNIYLFTKINLKKKNNNAERIFFDRYISTDLSEAWNILKLYFQDLMRTK